MSSKVIFRGRILMVIIAFTVLASAGLIYTSIKSLQPEGGVPQGEPTADGQAAGQPAEDGEVTDVDFEVVK